MAKLVKPLAVIGLALVAATLVAVFWARSTSEEARTAAAPATRDPGWIRGPQNSPITLVEYGDYQCPSCAAYHPVVARVLQRYPTQVKLEFHHFPLVQIHANALLASLAAEAAGEQGRFWEMHDVLFQQQNVWSPSLNPQSEFLVYASRLSLDPNRFMRAIRSPEAQQRVLEDVARARDLKIDSVPAFFLNSERIRPAASVEEFERLINQHLNRSK